MESATPPSTPERTPTPTPAPPARRVLTADQAIENASAGHDLVTEWIDDVFPDKDGVTGSVKIRALSAAQRARVKQAAIKQGRDTRIVWGEMERLQFYLGVVEPSFTEDQVRTLHLKAGPSFQKVIDALDKLSQIDKESLKQAEDDFREPGE